MKHQKPTATPLLKTNTSDSATIKTFAREYFPYSAGLIKSSLFAKMKT